MKGKLLLVLLCLAIYANAQQLTSTDHTQFARKGMWLAGLHTGYSEGRQWGHNMTAQAYAGCFATNKLWMGISATWSKEQFNQLKENNIAFGPMLRYQVTHTRFSPYVMAAYQIGNRSLAGEGKVDEWRGGFYVNNLNGANLTTYYPSFGGGLTIGLTSAVLLDVGFNWCGYWSSFGEGFSSGIRLNEGLYSPTIGINYTFGSK